MLPLQKKECPDCERYLFISEDEDYCFECDAKRAQDKGAYLLLFLLLLGVIGMWVFDSLHL